MGKKIDLKEAVNMIWETVKITEEQSQNKELPYIFIVGAGISAPEILAANGIVQHCQEKIKELYRDDEDVERIFEKSKEFAANSARYYSYWFGQAYKNKIHRQQYLKNIINKARISTSNLLLAQILNNKKIATTVITPNFDNQLLKSLNLLGNYNVFSANNVVDNVALSRNSSDIQLMHVHGTYEFYDCCNLEQEITKIANETGIKSTAGTIEEFLKNQAPIVIGYSGWEDDVIMSKIKERLLYAPLPYSLIWFCFSHKDYEMLPDWLKTSEDVFFVLPDKLSEEEKTAENAEKRNLLPAEDVFTALITKFEFEAPKLFSNPIQYYIDLIDGFFPENVDIFPIKTWKKKLDYIETHLGDIEKNIIKLDSASARKDVIEITRILGEIDYSFIASDDLEHILDGIIMTSLSAKNRIEDTRDIFAFIEIILELLYKKTKDIQTDKMKKYLAEVIAFFSEYVKKGNIVDARHILDNIIKICNREEKFEHIELITLGMKSDISDDEEKLSLQNQIIQRGIKKIQNREIARLVLVATIRQVRVQKCITEKNKKIMEDVLEEHSDNDIIKETYYTGMLGFYDDEISMGIHINDLVAQIKEIEVSKTVLLYARKIQCQNCEEIQGKVDIAKAAISEYKFELIDSCKECLDYSFLLSTIIIGNAKLHVSTERKYIDLGIKLCYKEDGCPYISQRIIECLQVYISSIESQFEKRDLCKKVIDICERDKLYEEWIYFCDEYINNVEKQEKEEFLEENERYKVYLEARNKMTIAVNEYVNNNKEICEKMLFDLSEIYEKIFEGEYNPALINISFMARRGEIPDLKVSAIDILNKITWWQNDAFVNINRALVYVGEGNWNDARTEIRNIEYSKSEAVEWWRNEQVVGQREKCIVLLLLALENKIDFSINEITSGEFWQKCEDSISIPDEIMKEFVALKFRCIISK